MRIVDDAGSEGELLLGGDCLAAGYVHRPELTAERFIERDGARWYRSGDRVRAAAGVLEYHGRLDEQLKIDGFRIEPAEIEAVLGRHAAVAEAIVVGADGAGGRHLVAHVVPRDPRADASALAEALREHCAAVLAAHLVPQAYRMWLSEFEIVLRDRVIPNGAVRIEDGRIAEIRDRPVEHADIRGGGRLLLPGFIDMRYQK